MAVENMNLKVSCMLTYANKCIPLTYIINTSILTGKFPTNWKIAKLIPLYQKGDKKSAQKFMDCRSLVFLSRHQTEFQKLIKLVMIDSESVSSGKVE